MAGARSGSAGWRRQLGRRWRSLRRSCTGRSMPRAAALRARSAARASPRTRCAWRSWCRYRVAGPGPGLAARLGSRRGGGGGSSAGPGVPCRCPPRCFGAAQPGLFPVPQLRGQGQPIFSRGSVACRSLSSPRQRCLQPSAVRSGGAAPRGAADGLQRCLRGSGAEFAVQCVSRGLCGSRARLREALCCHPAGRERRLAAGGKPWAPTGTRGAPHRGRGVSVWGVFCMRDRHRARQKALRAVSTPSSPCQRPELPQGWCWAGAGSSRALFARALRARSGQLHRAQPNAKAFSAVSSPRIVCLLGKRLARSRRGPRLVSEGWKLPAALCFGRCSGGMGREQSLCAGSPTLLAREARGGCWSKGEELPSRAGSLACPQQGGCRGDAG